MVAVAYDSLHQWSIMILSVHGRWCVVEHYHSGGGHQIVFGVDTVGPWQMVCGGTLSQWWWTPNSFWCGYCQSMADGVWWNIITVVVDTK